MNDDDVLETSEDGRFRVRLILDDSGDLNPRKEFDHLSHVITAYADDYINIDKDNGPLGTEWDEYLSLAADWSEAVTLFKRYCSIYHRAVTLFETPNEGAAAVWYLMAEDFHEVDSPADYLKAEAQEYRSWAEGDMWGYVVEELQTWRRVDPATDDPEERQEWGATDDSCWGLIGRECAEEAARDALSVATEEPRRALA